MFESSNLLHSCEDLSSPTSSSSLDVGERRSDKWLSCTATADHIMELVEDSRIPADHGLKSCFGDASPTKGQGESLILLDHICCGISLISVRSHFRIQLYHLSPNSIFAYLCCSKLGVEPSLDLFLHYYQLKISNSKRTHLYVSVNICFRPKYSAEYIPVNLKES